MYVCFRDEGASDEYQQCMFLWRNKKVIYLAISLI